MDDKVKKPTTIPVNSFDNEPKDVAVTDSSDDSINDAVEAESPVPVKPQPEELKEEAVIVESEPASVSSQTDDTLAANEQKPSQNGAVQYDSVPGNVEKEPSPAIDWAKRAESEPAAPVAVAIPAKHSHVMRNILIGVMVVAFAAAAAYVVYMFAMPNQAATDNVQVATPADPAATDPLTAIDAVVTDEISSETTAIEEQTAAETSSVDELSKESSDVSGAYDDSKF